MKCIVWNIEWASSSSPRGTVIRRRMDDVEPDVICLTETEHDFLPSSHRIEAGADYGYSHTGDRRKVVLWSRLPWTEVDAGKDELLPPGRFISGVTADIRFVGICIPWKDAHVKTGRRDRSPWEDHLAYCDSLGKILRRYEKSGIPMCVLGDFNQRIPRVNQPQNVYDALREALPPGFRLPTEGMVDLEGNRMIDHIVSSPDLSIAIDQFLSRFGDDQARLSDHTGFVATVTPALSENI